MNIAVIGRWQVGACIASLNRQSCWNSTLRTPDIVMSRCSLPILQTCYIWHGWWKTHCTSWTQFTAVVFYAICDSVIKRVVIVISIVTALTTSFHDSTTLV